MGHADIHIVVPTEMDEALASFQSTPKLLSQNSTNDFADTVQRQDTVVLKIECLHSTIFKPRDSHQEQATLAEKAQRRLDVCLFDTLVFIGREQYAGECLPDLREGNPFDLGVSTRVVAKCWIVFRDAILVHRNSYPRAKRNINQFIAYRNHNCQSTLESVCGLQSRGCQVSVEQPDFVDVISTDKQTGHVVLTISDHLDWSNSTNHQTILQAKLNRYLAFVESGEILT